MTPDQLPSTNDFKTAIDYVVLSEPAGTGHKVLHVFGKYIFRIETAAIEMSAVSRLSTHCMKPAWKLVISYRPGIVPTPEQAEADGSQTLSRIGLWEHQAVGGLHEKNGLCDLHLVANSVGFNGKAAHTPFLLARMYKCCAQISRNRGWPVTVNRFTRTQHETTAISAATRKTTDGTFYALHRGEMPWCEAISYLARPMIDQSATWDDFQSDLRHFGLEIEMINVTGRDGKKFRNLRYFLSHYPDVGCSATTLGKDFTYEALAARWGDIRYLDKAGIVGRNSERPKHLYAIAGQVIERCVEKGMLILPPAEHASILARKAMRSSWLTRRRSAKQISQSIFEAAWAEEQGLRSKETKARQMFKRQKRAAIRTCPQGRDQAWAMLDWDLKKRLQRDRIAAAARWQAKRAALQATFPALKLTYAEFVRQRAARGDQAAILVHADLTQRGLVATSINATTTTTNNTTNTTNTNITTASTPVTRSISPRPQPTVSAPGRSPIRGPTQT